MTINLRGGKDAGNRHTGAQRHGQVSRSQHYFLTAADVGGNGPERDIQLVEVAGCGHRQGQLSQGEIKFLTLDCPGREQHLAII